MLFDTAAFWKVLAIFIFVVLAIIAVSLLVDSYVRFMEWKFDRNERFKADVANLIVDTVNNNPYTGSCRETYEPEGAGNEGNEGNANKGIGRGAGNEGNEGNANKGIGSDL